MYNGELLGIEETIREDYTVTEGMLVQTGFCSKKCKKTL